MIKKLFYFFIFFAPFTSFFALSAWLRLPVVINQILFITLIIAIFQKNKIKVKWLAKEDLFLLIFLVLVWLSFLLGFRETRSFNHSLAYTNSILFYFFLSKYIVAAFDISSLKIAKIIYGSFIVCSLIIIVDFLGVNYYNFRLRDIFTTVDGRISNMDYYIRFGLLRVGGVAEEPGHMALFYNIYFGISLYYIHTKRTIKKYIFPSFLFVICHFAMLSNAGIILAIVALVIVFLVNKLKRLKISPKQIVITSVLLLLFTTISLILLFFDIGTTKQVLSEFFAKIFFNEDQGYSSSGQRLVQWERALTNFIKHPIFGNGPGYGVNEDPEGYLSVYLTILSDIGIIALLLFLSYQKVLVQKVLNLNSNIRAFLLFSVLTSFIHLVIIADFYHAPFWILLVFIQLVYKEQKIGSV